VLKMHTPGPMGKKTESAWGIQGRERELTSVIAMPLPKGVRRVANEWGKRNKTSSQTNDKGGAPGKFTRFGLKKEGLQLKAHGKTLGWEPSISKYPQPFLRGG